MVRINLHQESLAGNILTLTEVVTLTKFSKRYIYNKMIKGEFPHPVIRTSRKCLWHINDIEDFLQKLASNNK